MSWALLATQGIRNELLVTVAGRILRYDGDTMVKPGDTGMVYGPYSNPELTLSNSP